MNTRSRAGCFLRERQKSQMKQRTAAGCIFLLWLGTFLLVIPAQFHLPQAITFVGFSLVMFAPMSWLTRSELYLVADYSYWIGLMVMLAVSVLLMLISGQSRHSVWLVGLVDLAVIAVSLAWELSLPSSP
jgi:hypothetical protein